MKIATLTESSVDDAAIRILVQSIIGDEVEFISTTSLETRDTKKGGYSNLRKHLSDFLRHLYYDTDAECVVIVVDSDDDPIHQAEREIEEESENCRLCVLRRDIKKIQSHITPIGNKAHIKTAVGLAVPAIEAWFRCIEDSHITEATWARKLNGEKINYDRKSLKKDVYGGERSPTKEKSIEAAQVIASRLDYLEEIFPQGFGSLVKDIKSW
jgi:hypothetical protein